jgi:uncharacterized protein YeaO (DUF488 family)
MIRIKRIYEKKSKEDGYRILIDRLWPRGITKEEAGVDLWLKEISPSAGLRKWFSHDPKKWEAFRKRYELELKSKGTQIETLNQLEKEKGIITLLYSAKNEKYNNAIVLAGLFAKRG